MPGWVAHYSSTALIVNYQLCGYLFSICPPCELLGAGIPVSFLPVPPRLVAFNQPLLRGREAIFVMLGSEKGLTKQCLADILGMDLSLTFAVRAGTQHYGGCVTCH